MTHLYKNIVDWRHFDNRGTLAHWMNEECKKRPLVIVSTFVYNDFITVYYFYADGGPVSSQM